MSPTYFWKDGALVTLNIATELDIREGGLLGYPAVTQDVQYKCGQFVTFSERYDTVSWMPLTLEELPLEFRTQLLLLGVNL